jgi:hypothetical protein
MSVRQGDVDNALEVFVELAIDLLAVPWDIYKSSELAAVAILKKGLYMVISSLFAQAVVLKEVNDVLGAAMSLKVFSKGSIR